LCRHLQWEFGLIHRGRQRLVPGKSVTGRFTFRFDDLRRCDVRGHAESESLLTLLEAGRPPIGNIPTVLDLVDLNYDFQKGRPTQLEVNLRSAQTLTDAREPDRPKVLHLRATGKRIATGDEKFVLDLSTLLQDFCATDVGERLNLKGRLAGRLTGRAELVHDAVRGETRMEAHAKLSDDARVLVPHPTDPQRSEWQPLRLEADLDAFARPNARGELAAIEARFKAHADSFEAESILPAKFESLDEWDKLRIHTQFKMNLRGREFWAEFGPVLGLFGLERPIEEVLGLNVTVYSGTEEPAAAGGRGTRRISLANTTSRGSSPLPSQM
jgi:hypothetical protein